MADHLDVPLEDAVLMEEVELISTLMIGASEAEGHLDQHAIDQLLGLPEEREPASSSAGSSGSSSVPEQQSGRSAR